MASGDTVAASGVGDLVLPDSLLAALERRFVERAVFGLNEDGLVLEELAPGADLERGVLSRMSFRPAILAEPRTMDPRLFRPEPVGLVTLWNGDC